jgi:hypothetical protein
MTNNNVVTWIVEEVEANGLKKTFTYPSYDEAMDVFNNLKLEHKDSFISIQKSEKKLLTG